jgi:predicted RNase H-like HicB family nuclease
MLTAYINEAMARANYKILEDGTYFGEIPGLSGVWANESNLEDCRRVLQEVLEEWLLLKLRENEDIPSLGKVKLSIKKGVRL